MANHRVTPDELREVVRILATRIAPTHNEKVMLFACTFQLECFKALEEWNKGMLSTNELEDSLIAAVNARYMG